jgi:hypothetical protein
LAYLEARGIDPGTAVKLVVASHWHDDHIRGLSQVLRACPVAKFFCPAALLSEQFVTLVSASSKRSMMRSTSGVDEFNKILEELERRRPKSGKLLGTGLDYVKCDTRLWQRGGTPSVEVWSLSPSSAEYEQSIMQFAALLPTVGQDSQAETRRRIVSTRPNNTAIALWVRVGTTEILLGADLEETGHADAGWSAVVASVARPQSAATLFKVAHHGSKNGHHLPVWTQMLTQSGPISILTPFRRGSIKLPTSSDVERIKGLTRDLYTSMAREPKRPKPTNRVIARAFQEGALKIQEVDTTGRVSASIENSSTSAWQVTVANGAARL